MISLEISFNGESSFNNYILSEVKALVEKEGLTFYFERTYQKDFEQIHLYLPNATPQKTVNGLVVCVERIFSNMYEMEVVEESRLIASELLGFLSEDDRFTQIKVVNTKADFVSHFSPALHQKVANLFILQREEAFSSKDIAWRMTTLFHHAYNSNNFSQLETPVVNFWDDKNAPMKDFLRERAKNIVADYATPSLPLAVCDSGMLSVFEAELQQVIDNMGQQAIFAIYEALNLLGFNAIESWYLLNIGFYGLRKEAA